MSPSCRELLFSSAGPSNYDPVKTTARTGSCWQVCRPGSVATHWEYRNNPLVDLEKVRAFAMRYACTHPSLCLMLTGALFRLDLRRPAMAVCRAPAVAGPSRQWGPGAPR